MENIKAQKVTNILALIFYYRTESTQIKIMQGNVISKRFSVYVSVL